MAQNQTSFYLNAVAATPPSGLTLPAGALGTWGTANAATSGSNACGFASLTLNAQVGIGVAVSATGTYLLAQFVSDRLSGQAQVSAANWKVGVALAQTGTNTITAQASLFLVNGATGAIRTTIFGGATPVGVGASRAVAAEEQCLSSTIAGVAFTPQAGDYLILEIGVNNATAVASTVTLDTSGSTAIASDTGAIASAQSILTSPAALALQGVHTFYPMLTVPQDGNSVLPSGYFGTYTAANAAQGGANALLLAPYSRTNQVTLSSATTWAASTNSAFAQFLSEPLAAQTVPAGSLSVGFASSASSASANWRGVCNVYLINGATGAIRTTILTTNVVGASRASIVEKTVYVLVAYSSFTAVAGDYIAVELGIANGVGQGTAFILYAEGNTVITSDNAATAQAQTYINFPYSLLTQSALLSPSSPAGTSGSTAPNGILPTADRSWLQTFYLHVNWLAVTPTLPTGWLSTFTGGNNTQAGSSVQLMDGYVGTGSFSNNYSPTADTSSHGLIQFQSPPLKAGSISAANWTVALATQSNVATTHQILVAIYLVNGGTGAIRTTIKALGQVGANHAATTILAAYSTTVAGSAATITAGDYIVVEVGFQYTSLPTAPNMTVYAEGTTLFSTDNAVVANPRALITAPAPLAIQQTTLYLHAGQRGNVSVWPTAYSAGWVDGIAANGTTSALLADTGPGNGVQVSLAKTAIGDTSNHAIAQFVTPPLAAQTISMRAVMIAIAASASTATSRLTVGALLLINGATGAVRTSLLSPNTITASGQTSTSETFYADNSLSAGSSSIAVTDGDYLLIEVGVAYGATPTNATFTIFTDGATYFTTNGAVITSGVSSFTFYADLVFKSTALAIEMGGSAGPVPVATPTVAVSTGTVADAPGMAQGKHFFYAESTGLWWFFYFSSTSATTLYAICTPDFVNWTTPTNNTFTLANGNDGFGRQLQVDHRNVNGVDVVHIGLFYQKHAASDFNAHVRARVAGTTITWDAENVYDNNSAASTIPLSPATAIATTGTVMQLDYTAAEKTLATKISSTADTGTPQWLNTWAATQTFQVAATAVTATAAILPLSAGRFVGVGVSGSSSTPNNLVISLWNVTWAGAFNVFLSSVNINANDWGVCVRTDTDIHVVRYEGSGVFTHRRGDGSSMSAGNSIPSLTAKVGAGTPLVSDGISVWLFAIANDSANTVYYTRWTSGTGWSSWIALVGTTQVRNYLTAVYGGSPGAIGLSWCQTNGANYDLVATLMPVTAPIALQNLIFPSPVIAQSGVIPAAIFPTTIVSTGTYTDGPGMAQQPHLFYAENTGLWWAFTYSSASSGNIVARYSPDLGNWFAPTNSTFFQAHANQGHAKQMGLDYANIAGVDVVHFNLAYFTGTNDFTTHLRATLSGTTITWGTESQINTDAFSTAAVFTGATAIASDGFIYDAEFARGTRAGYPVAARSSNADTGAAWTSGFAAETVLLATTLNTHSMTFLPLTTGGKVLALYDLGDSNSAPTNVEARLWDGVSAWGSQQEVFATGVGIDPDDWGACLRTDADVHVVRRNDATSTFTHRRAVPGSAFTAGDAIPTIGCKAGAGVALISDGVLVYLFTIDVASANAISYCVWTPGIGWGSWINYVSSSHTRTSLALAYSADRGTIAVQWSQVNGANFDYAVAGLVVEHAVPLLPLVARMSLSPAQGFSGDPGVGTAVTVVTSTGTVADAPGFGQDTNLWYAENTGLWWYFYYASTSATTLYALYSADLLTWSTPTNNAFTLAHTNNGSGVQLASGYKDIAGVDVFYFSIFSGGTDASTALRATVAGTTVTWGTEATLGTRGSTALRLGGAVAIGSDNKAMVQQQTWTSPSHLGNISPAQATNADTGAAWTAGWNAPTMVFSTANYAGSFALFPLSTGGQILALGGNGDGVSGARGLWTNVESALWNGSSWGSAIDVFATNQAGDTDDNNWGACLRTDADAHAVKRNDGTGAFTHRRSVPGSAWSAGSAIPTNVAKDGAGLAMVSDGVRVYLFIIDNGAANAVKYCVWTPQFGWGSWITFISTTAVRSFLTASYSADKGVIALSWATVNGSNYDLTVAALAIAPAVPVLPLKDALALSTTANRIVNGDFETPATILPWVVYVINGAAMTLVRDTTQHADGAASGHVNVSVSTGTSWEAKTILPAGPLINGRTYQFSVWVKGNTGNNIGIQVQQNYGSFDTLVYSGAVFPVTAQWTLYSVSFTAAADDPGPINIYINCGAATGDIWLDSAVFQEVGPTSGDGGPMALALLNALVLGTAAGTSGSTASSVDAESPGTASGAAGGTGALVDRLAPSTAAGTGGGTASVVDNLAPSTAAGTSGSTAALASVLVLALSTAAGTSGTTASDVAAESPGTAAGTGGGSASLADALAPSTAAGTGASAASAVDALAPSTAAGTSGSTATLALTIPLALSTAAGTSGSTASAVDAESPGTAAGNAGGSTSLVDALAPSTAAGNAGGSASAVDRLSPSTAAGLSGSTAALTYALALAPSTATGTGGSTASSVDAEAPGTASGTAGSSGSLRDLLELGSMVGVPDNVLCGGQIIALPHEPAGDTLAFLGTATGGAQSGAGTVYYTDGTTLGYTLGYEDWTYTGSPGHGETREVSLSERNIADGGTEVRTISLYVLKVTLDSAKRVSRILLPSVGTFGSSPVLHVFSMSIALAGVVDASTQAALEAAFNNEGISDDGNHVTTTGHGIDWDGNSLSRQDLRAHGLVPGTVVTLASVPFTWGQPGYGLSGSSVSLVDALAPSTAAGISGSTVALNVTVPLILGTASGTSGSTASGVDAESPGTASGTAGGSASLVDTLDPSTAAGSSGSTLAITRITPMILGTAAGTSGSTASSVDAEAPGAASGLAGGAVSLTDALAPSSAPGVAASSASLVDALAPSTASGIAASTASLVQTDALVLSPASGTSGSTVSTVDAAAPGTASGSSGSSVGLVDAIAPATASGSSGSSAALTDALAPGTAAGLAGSSLTMVFTQALAPSTAAGSAGGTVSVVDREAPGLADGTSGSSAALVDALAPAVAAATGSSTASLASALDPSPASGVGGSTASLVDALAPSPASGISGATAAPDDTIAPSTAAGLAGSGNVDLNLILALDPSTASGHSGTALTFNGQATLDPSPTGGTGGSTLGAAFLDPSPASGASGSTLTPLYEAPLVPGTADAHATTTASLVAALDPSAASGQSGSTAADLAVTTPGATGGSSDSAVGLVAALAPSPAAGVSDSSADLITQAISTASGASGSTAVLVDLLDPSVAAGVSGSSLALLYTAALVLQPGGGTGGGTVGTADALDPGPASAAADSAAVLTDRLAPSTASGTADSAVVLRSRLAPSTATGTGGSALAALVDALALSASGQSGSSALITAALDPSPAAGQSDSSLILGGTFPLHLSTAAGVASIAVSLPGEATIVPVAAAGIAGGSATLVALQAPSTPSGLSGATVGLVAILAPSTAAGASGTTLALVAPLALAPAGGQSGTVVLLTAGLVASHAAGTSGTAASLVAALHPSPAAGLSGTTAIMGAQDNLETGVSAGRSDTTVALVAAMTFLTGGTSGSVVVLERVLTLGLHPTGGISSTLMRTGLGASTPGPEWIETGSLPAGDADTFAVGAGAQDSGVIPSDDAMATIPVEQVDDASF